MRKPGVLFICKDRNSYGNCPYLKGSYGLMNSASFVSSYLSGCGYNSKTVLATDGNCVDRLAVESDAEYIVIEALWVTPAKLKELSSLHRHRHRKWVVRLHSRIPFIANEGVAFSWLSGYADLHLDNLWAAPNVEEFARDLFAVFGLQSAWLPNIYSPPKYDFVREQKPKGILDVGCFGAIRPMKNTLTQAVAAIRFAEQHKMALRFHVNGVRCEQGGDQVMRNLEALFAVQEDRQLVSHKWLPHQEFNQVIKQMDMGMQVSFTETFNIVAADFVVNHVPLIGSSAINWLPTGLQADPNSTDSILETMNFAWHWPGNWLHRVARGNLERTNKEAGKVWKDFLK